MSDAALRLRCARCGWYRDAPSHSRPYGRKLSHLTASANGGSVSYTTHGFEEREAPPMPFVTLDGAALVGALDDAVRHPPPVSVRLGLRDELSPALETLAADVAALAQRQELERQELEARRVKLATAAVAAGLFLWLLAGVVFGFAGFVVAGLVVCATASSSALFIALDRRP